MPPRIALATEAAHPQLADDDRLLVLALRALGLDAEPAVWSDPDVRWRRFDLVLVRSCWDYHRRLGEFVTWLAALEASGVSVRNPPALLRWNAHKRYLHELAQDGVRVVPGTWIRPGGLARALEARGWNEAVVKPGVGASAEGIFRTSRAAAADGERRLRELRGRSGAGDEFLLQPFVPTVATDGEWSLVFLSDGRALRFSHAVCKRPATGDFRVQRELGGSAVAARPEAGLVVDASTAVDAACAASGAPARDVLYARVDGVVRRGRLQLMELECIEPELFFAADRHAAHRLAAAIASRLGERPAPPAAT